MDSRITTLGQIGLQEITTYLEAEFGETFSTDYYLDFKNAVQTLRTFPEAFPIASEKKQLRKLVFRKRTSIYYKARNIIEVVAIIDNRQDYQV